MSFERRASLRANAVIPVEVRDARGFALYSTRDISSTGLFFDRAMPFKLGARVSLVFTLPGEASAIRCDGEVVNVPDTQGFGMGIRFLDIAPDDAQRVAGFARETLEGP